ncbi:mitochondrial carrier, partial [Lepidopterella palustris CBS 459.81]
MTTAQVVPLRRSSREAAICPTDDESLVPKKEQVRQKVDKRSTEYIIKSGLAGGIAGCAAKTVVGPLDRVKILFQTSNPNFTKYTGKWTGVPIAMKDIWLQDGPRGLFKGHSATLLRIFPYAGIKFLAYEQIRAHFIRDRSQETPVRRFISGSMAGCVSVFFTYPLEVIRVRLAFETRNDSRSTLRSICRIIYNERPPPVHAPAQLGPVTAVAAVMHQAAPRYGLANFFRGFTPTLLGMLPYAGASFLAHDTVSDLLRLPAVAGYTTLPNMAGSAHDPHKPAQLRYWAELSTGGFAGFTSQTVSYPLEVIRRRMQVGGVVGDGHRLSMAEVTRRIYMERGWRGFFVGLSIG